MAELEFFYDFVSPYSYLASTRVEALAARTGATLRSPVSRASALRSASSFLRMATMVDDCEASCCSVCTSIARS